jgi:hypothetical protein
MLNFIIDGALEDGGLLLIDLCTLISGIVLVALVIVGFDMRRDE